jgi:hypothetical protein
VHDPVQLIEAGVHLGPGRRDGPLARRGRHANGARRRYEAAEVIVLVDPAPGALDVLDELAARGFNYADGVLIQQDTSSGTIPTAANPPTIGVNPTYDFTRFAGNLTDVRLWDVARTPSRVAGEMWGITDTVGLVGQRQLDNETGQVATDDSGNGFGGQLGGSPSSDDRDPVWSAELPEQ